MEKNQQKKCKECNYILDDNENYVYFDGDYYCLEPCFLSKFNELKF